MSQQQGNLYSGWDDPEMDKERSFAPRRFWLPQGGVGKVILVDGIPHTLDEHQLKIGDSWQNWIPCMNCFHKLLQSQGKPLEPCLVCEEGGTPYRIGFLTAVTFWQKKGESDWNASKQLFGLKQSSFQAFRELLSTRGGNAAGWVVKCIRAGEKDAAIGGQFDFERRITGGKADPTQEDIIVGISQEIRAKGVRVKTGKNQSLAEWLQPFNYEELFLIPTVDQQLRIVARSGGRAAARRDEPMPTGQDSIPF